MLELTLARLRSFGITEVIINTHHFAEMVAEFLSAHQNFGMHVEISHEERLLDTGTFGVNARCGQAERGASSAVRIGFSVYFGTGLQ